jgi:hypothetical protein
MSFSVKETKPKIHKDGKHSILSTLNSHQLQIPNKTNGGPLIPYTKPCLNSYSNKGCTAALKCGDYLTILSSLPTNMGSYVILNGEILARMRTPTRQTKLDLILFWVKWKHTSLQDKTSRLMGGTRWSCPNKMLVISNSRAITKRILGRTYIGPR